MRFVLGVVMLLGTFYAATVVMDLIDWPKADMSAFDCNQPVCPGDDEP